jgi:hypothetical protein
MRRQKDAGALISLGPAERRRQGFGILAAAGRQEPAALVRLHPWIQAF